jgi:hypothetical protein
MTAVEPVPLESQEQRTAILDAEARRLAHTLARYGVLTCWQLAELSGAHRWQRGRFSHALSTAIEKEMIRELGCNFYAPSQPSPTNRNARISEAPGVRGRRFSLHLRRVDRAD